MAQDYAKRSNSARRPAARKNTPPPQPPKRQLWPAVAALVLIIALAGGLYKLSSVDTDPQATQQSVQQAPKQAPVKNPQPAANASNVTKLPEKTDPEYKFYKLLPESEVVPAEVEAYRSTPKSAADYSKHLLQAGSFRRAEDADSLRAKLLLTGMPNVTTSKVVSSSGSTWYRVRIGPFTSRSKLNKAYDQLVRMNLQPLQVTL